MKSQCWVTMLRYYRICCTSRRLDLLSTNASQKVLYIFCWCKSFFAGATTLPCKLRSLLSKRVMKKDYRSSSQKSDECVENNGWQRGSGSSESRMSILDWLLVRRSHQTRVKYSTCFDSEDTLLTVT